MKTTYNTWYEAVMVKGFGCKLADHYSTKEEAEAAIIEVNNKETAMGYKPSNYYIMQCASNLAFDENNDVIFETIVKAKV